MAKQITPTPLERGRLQLISLRKSAKKEGHPAEKAKVKEGHAHKGVADL